MLAEILENRQNLPTSNAQRSTVCYGGGDDIYSTDRSDQVLAQCSCDDEALQHRVEQFLFDRGVDSLSDIQVTVSRGVVTLHGVVASPHERWLCICCARRVAGVIRVEDELEVAPRAVFKPRAR